MMEETPTETQPEPNPALTSSMPMSAAQAVEVARAFVEVARALEKAANQLRGVRADRWKTRIGVAAVTVVGTAGLIFAGSQARDAHVNTERIRQIQEDNHRLLVEAEPLLTPAAQSAQQAGQQALVHHLVVCQYENDWAVAHGLPEPVDCKS